MKIWREYYGADADGNRGEWRTYAELEESDADDVKELIAEQYDGSDQYLIEIDGFEFEVFASEWLTNDEIEVLEGE